MNKILVIGDIHGSDIWKDIIKVNQDFNKCIFLGDYLDSHVLPDNVILDNFKDIIDFKNKYDNVILLIGNHEYHYIESTSCYSGYRDSYAKYAKDLIEDAQLKFIHIEDDIIFSHAGVTKTWLNDIANCTVEEINNLSIDKFKFRGNDFYGDSVISSPIWVRPYSLEYDAIDNYKQVIGHTNFKQIQVLLNNNIYICDTLPNQYLTIIDKEFIINNF